MGEEKSVVQSNAGAGAVGSDNIEKFLRANSHRDAPEDSEGPSIQEEMIAAAEKGDLDGVMAAWTKHDFPDAVVSEAMAATQVVLQKLSADPTRMVDAIFSRLLVFQTQLLLRAEMHVAKATRDQDKRMTGKLDLPEDVKKSWLPRINGIHEAIQRTVKNYAAAKHTMTLGISPNKAREPVMSLVDRQYAKERVAAGE